MLAADLALIVPMLISDRPDSYERQEKDEATTPGSSSGSLSDRRTTTRRSIAPGDWGVGEVIGRTRRNKSKGRVKKLLNSLQHTLRRGSGRFGGASPDEPWLSPSRVQRRTRHQLQIGYDTFYNKQKSHLGTRLYSLSSSLSSGPSL